MENWILTVGNNPKNKEFDLLHLLLSSIGRVYTHEQIYKYAWGDEKDDVGYCINMAFE